MSYINPPISDLTTSSLSQPPTYELIHPSRPGTTSRTNFAILFMHRNNYLQLLQFPESVALSLATAAILPSWPKGLKCQQYTDGAYEYTFNGEPWGGYSRDDSINSRTLMCAMLQHLYSEGWVLDSSLCNTIHKFDKDTLIFRQMEADDGPRRSPPAYIREDEEDGVEKASTSMVPSAPREIDVVGISMVSCDRLRLHFPKTPFSAKGSDDDGPSHKPLIIASLQSLLDRTDYLQSTSVVDGAFEFKMKGWPWIALFGQGPQRLRRLMLAITETMDRMGWRTYATVKQREMRDTPKLDSWYFVRPKGWIEGSPFNYGAGWTRRVY